MNRETLRLYWRHVRPSKTAFFISLIAIPLGFTIVDSILPYLLSLAIGELTTDGDALWKFLGIAAGVGAIGAILNYIGFQAMVAHEGQTIERLRQSTFTSLVHKDNAFFVNQKIGSMTSKYIDFVRNYVTLQDLLIIRTLGFTLSVGTGLAILLMHSWIVAALIAFFIVILCVQIRWSAKKRAPWRHEHKKLVAEIHGDVADVLTNNSVVRSYASADREAESLQRKTKRFTHLYNKDFGFMAAEGSIRTLFMILIQVGAVALSAYFVHAGTLDLPAAIFILAYMQRIGSQIFTLGDIINGYDRAFLEAQPMTEMLLAENAVTDAPHAVSLNVKKPALVFDHTSYHYSDNETHVIDDISLHIPAGQKVGLVGQSGAGKSTIIRLLLRFSDVTGGSISIGKQDIRSVTQQSLHKSIAYVPQEPMLFHRSLRDNIAYGKPDATDAEIKKAARAAHALKFINKLPEGLDTIVGERGVKLSGGQRQRIAIARAILKDAPILVLDEATSALDSESEKLIQSSLEKLMKGRTSIVVAHRLSTIAKLDRIIVLDQGRIKEDGTHHELLTRKNGTYAKLWAHQSGGFIEE